MDMFLNCTKYCRTYTIGVSTDLWHLHEPVPDSSLQATAEDGVEQMTLDGAGITVWLIYVFKVNGLVHSN